MNAAAETYEVVIDGRKRTVTLAEFKAEMARRAAMAKPIMEALKRGDIEGCARAQAVMSERFA